MTEALTRPIAGIENRTAQEVFDIMCDRIRLSASPAGVVKDGDIAAIISDDAAPDPANIALAQKGIAAGFDNHSVNQFAFAMRAKLAEKRREGRGGWHDKDYCSGEYLSRLLREHVEKGDPVDVANFCMMLHQRGERIMSAIEPAGVGVETDGDPIDTIKAAMEERGLTNVDLYGIFGSKARVSEVMRRRRPLLVKHIRGLHELLGVPHATLIHDYALDPAALTKEGEQ
jgi:antitoxin component HigA of HigAB toxin-antitoxin module